MQQEQRTFSDAWVEVIAGTIAIVVLLWLVCLTCGCAGVCDRPPCPTPDVSEEEDVAAGNESDTASDDQEDVATDSPGKPGDPDSDDCTTTIVFTPVWDGGNCWARRVASTDCANGMQLPDWPAVTYSLTIAPPAHEDATVGGLSWAGVTPGARLIYTTSLARTLENPDGMVCQDLAAITMIIQRHNCGCPKP